MTLVEGPGMMLPIAEIGELDAANYVGLIDETAIGCLAARLEIEGLLTPIWVRRNGNAAKARWGVIAGRHRLLAALRLGWTEIAVVEKAGPGSKVAELRALQVAENLDRRTLRPIERAIFIMDRWAISAQNAASPIAKNQQTRAALARWSAWEAISHTLTGSRRAIDALVAEDLAQTGRTVRTYRRIFERIVAELPDHYAQLNAHPLGAELAAISTVAGEKRLDLRALIVNTILSRNDWPSIEAVMVACGLEGSKGNRATPLHKAQEHWVKLSYEDRGTHLQWLADKLLPSEAIAIVKRIEQRGVLP